MIDFGADFKLSLGILPTYQFVLDYTPRVSSFGVPKYPTSSLIKGQLKRKYGPAEILIGTLKPVNLELLKKFARLNFLKSVNLLNCQENVTKCLMKFPVLVMIFARISKVGP